MRMTLALFTLGRRSEALINCFVRLTIIHVVGAVLTGCAIWDPLDYNNYLGRADAVLTVDKREYRASWNVPISRMSSFSPYSKTGRQDCWRFVWGGGPVTLNDGTHLWIDASKAVPKSEEARLLGITGAQPIPRPPRSNDMLEPDHPVVVEMPVYISATNDRPTRLIPYRGRCGSDGDKACRATVQFSVPHDYIGPYDRNPANVLEWLPGVCNNL